jgi:hypothetical protein
MAEELSSEELARRVSILRRFRELLTAQRDRFHQYLEVLDKQKTQLESAGGQEAVGGPVDLEERLIADIFSIQKVIEPMEILYRSVWPGNQPVGTAESAADIPQLKTSLQSLKAEAAIRLNQNKELLQRRMNETRHELKTLRSNPFAARQPIYGKSAAPSLIDIQG